MAMFVTLIVVIVLQVYAYVQIHQILNIKYMQFFVYQLYLCKVVKSNKVKFYEIKYFYKQNGQYLYLKVDYFD